MKGSSRILCALLVVIFLSTIPVYAQEDKVDFGGRTLKVAVWYEPEIPTLGNSDSEDAWYERDTCTPMFNAALFIIARTLEASKMSISR